MNEQVWWYLSRSSGIVALVLLVASVVWGVLLATRVLKPHDRPAWLLDLHRWLGGMALAMTGLHMLGLYLDGYVDFGAGELLVPGLSPYRPLAVAIGVLSFYVLVAVQATSYMRRWLSKRVWHGIHLLSYGLVWGAAIHAGLAGTDVANRLYQALALFLTVAAVAATAVRISAPKRAAGRSASTVPTAGGTGGEPSVDPTGEVGHRAETVRQ
jgi:DMSO/TMAO reductase YedYZ heme-binding membrane subunit